MASVIVASFLFLMKFTVNNNTIASTMIVLVITNLDKLYWAPVVHNHTMHYTVLNSDKTTILQITIS